MEEHGRRQSGRWSGGARKEELMWIMGRRSTGGAGVRRKLRQSQGPTELSRLRAVLLGMGEEEHRRSSGSHRVAELGGTGKKRLGGWKDDRRTRGARAELWGRSSSLGLK
jgi:hypothetical protein